KWNRRCLSICYTSLLCGSTTEAVLATRVSPARKDEQRGAAHIDQLAHLRLNFVEQSLAKRFRRGLDVGARQFMLGARPLRIACRRRGSRRNEQASATLLSASVVEGPAK